MLYICAVSDSIGETANQVVLAASSQFKEKTKVRRYSYINTLEEVNKLIEEISIYDKVMIVSTIIDVKIREFLTEKAIEKNIFVVNVLGPIINIASTLLNCIPSYIPGAVRNIDEEYFKRIEAIEFAIQYDDSKDYRGLKNADVVLIGLSRTAKTPLCMYLANKGIKAINIPLIPEVGVPDELFELDRKKIFCLTIDPLELIEIRRKRIDKFNKISAEIQYAGEERVLKEFEYLDRINKKLNCRIIDVTKRAIEDTALIIEEAIKK